MMSLINKKMLLACWSINNPYWIINQAYNIPLRKIFSEVINFDPQEETYKHGKKIMNEKFLKLLQKEKPDYIHLFLVWDEFYPETLIKIKEILPNVKVTHWNGDDDIKFDNYTIPYSYAIDYQFISQLQFTKRYDSYGIPWFDLLGADTGKFKPLNVKKKYDVLFVGTPKGDRLKYMRFLLKKGVNFVLGGAGWDDYPEFKDHYLGKIPEEEIVKIINESKINLCFSQNFFSVPHVLERSLAVNACKSFALTEYVEGYFSKFTEGKDFASFKNEDELYKKINYYLKNEKEREKIAENAYKIIVKRFSNLGLLTEAYKAIEKNRKPLYGNISRKYLAEKPVYLDQDDLKKGYGHVKKKISDYKYVGFKNKGYEILPYRDYVQIYSMELIGKPISVCDLLLSSKIIGDYASLSLYYAYNYLQNNGSYIKDNLDVSQLMVRKDYLLTNFEKFKQLYKKEFNIQKETTSFISIPLIKTHKIKKIPVVGTDHILFGLFEMNLVNLRNQKKLFTDSYLYKLAFYSIFVNPQILKYILVNSIKRTKNKKWIRISDHILRFFFKNN